MRALTDDERKVVLQLAAKIASEAERNQVIADLDHCMVEEKVPDGSLLRVAIEHYQRPSGHGRGLYRARDDPEVTGIVKETMAQRWRCCSLRTQIIGYGISRSFGTILDP